MGPYLFQVGWVRWRHAAQGPSTMGVLGADPFGPARTELLAGERPHGRRARPGRIGKTNQGTK